jgi:hypothetical protein
MTVPARSVRALAGSKPNRFAIRRGEVPETTDPRLALQALIGPLHFRALLTREPLGGQLPEQLADLVIDGLGTA